MRVAVPGFADVVPTWPHRSLSDNHDLFERSYEEPARSVVLTAARQHELSLAQTPGVAYGMLWVPDKTTGVVMGTGSVTRGVFDEPMDIDRVLEQVNFYQRSFREKVHQFEHGRTPDLDLGPTGYQALKRTRRGSREIECIHTLYVMLDELTVAAFTMSWLDPVHEEAMLGDMVKVLAYSRVVEVP